MSFKPIKHYLNFCRQLLAAIQLNDFAKAQEWIKRIENETSMLRRACPQQELEPLFQKILELIGNLQASHEPSALQHNASQLFNLVHGIQDQNKVRAALVREIIKPQFREWGFETKRKKFTKGDTEIVVRNSNNSNFLEVQFWLASKNLPLPHNRFFLTPTTNIAEVKLQITNYLTTLAAFLQSHKIL